MARRSRSKTMSQVERYIRDAAVKRGIDPDVAVRVAKSEGLGGSWQSNVVKNGVREPSYGEFQLFTGGGLGNQFAKKTGLDPRNQKNRFAMIDFALDQAAKSGWGAWYGAKKAGVSKWTGLKGAQPIGISQVAENVPVPQARPEMQIADAFAEPEQPKADFGLASLFGVSPAAASEMPSAPQAAPLSAPDAYAGIAAQPVAKGVSDFMAGNMARVAKQAGIPDPVAETEADVQRMERDAGMYQPAAAPAPERFGPAPSQFGSLLDQDAGAMGMEGGAPFAGFDAQRGLADMDRFGSTPALQSDPAALGAMVGAMAGPRSKPAIGSVFQSDNPADVYAADAAMNPKGNPDTMVAPNPAAEQAAMAAMQGPDAARMAFADEPAPAPAVAAANAAVTAPTAPAANAAAFDPTKGLGLPGNLQFDINNFEDTLAGLNQLAPQAAQPIDTPQTIADAPIASVDDGPTIGQFPAAPEDPTGFDFMDALGWATNPIGKALGKAFGDDFSLGDMFDGPAGKAPADIDAGTGMQAIESGMYGERGTFGRSASNPGAFSVSRGPGQGWDLTNAAGVTTPYSASGNVMANADTMRAWGDVLGGLFDSPEKSSSGKRDKDRERSISERASHAIDSGWGGLW